MPPISVSKQKIINIIHTDDKQIINTTRKQLTERVFLLAFSYVTKTKL